MTEDVLSVDLVELPMRIGKNNNRCFKDYLVQLQISPQVKCKKLIEVQPILIYRVCTQVSSR